MVFRFFVPEDTHTFPQTGLDIRSSASCRHFSAVTLMGKLYIDTLRADKLSIIKWVKVSEGLLSWDNLTFIYLLS